MKKILILLLGCLFMLPTWAASSETEINQLLQQIRTSPCQFNRNGDWFLGAEAAKHIEKKYHYFRDKNKINNSEDFIRLAATKSEMSGKPYLMKCAGQAEIEMASWLQTSLKKLRQTP